MKTLYGLTVAMLTPINDDDKVDYGAIRQLTETLISKGVNGLYPCGTTGEMMRLTVDERKRIVETVREQAAGRVLVYAHVGAASQADTIELAKHAETTGCDGIGVISPQFYKLNEREMEEFYVAVASSVSENFPVYLYNIPPSTNNDITPACAQRIAERCKNVVGIKYSFADIKRVLDYTFLNDGDFRVVVGTDKILAAAMAVGCDGSISGNASVFPEPLVALYDAAKRHDLPAVKKWTKLTAAFAEALTSGTNLGYYKYALSLRGISGGHVRRPALNITESEKLDLEKKLRRLCDEAGIELLF